MRRTLQTTQISLQWLIKSGVPVDVEAMWQENSNAACDTGSDLEVLAKEFPDLDFTNVDPTYPDKADNTPYAFTRTANQARGEACLKALYSRPEKVIAIVSHAGFLRTGITRRRFENADYRVFTFARDSEGNLELFEDSATEKKGGGMGRSAKGIYLLNDWDFPPENIEEVEEDEDEA
ncbi:hypothetical protein PRZ48_008670 [Zasmidium cellare]|uniref:Phosphoglycerate mutase n=1 Tax=Zasmidium cellare TaxID=395010 RepID=A0ABR0EGW3_ZASCE|nr:hypothetical protein PRZ48_008670 [Zasmidium cellare]